jgi:transposase-like protein
MARRRGHTEEQILAALWEAKGGTTVVDVCRQVGISDQTFYVWKRKYAPCDTVLEGLEKQAREAQRGLWADPQPVPPWEWRKRR